MWDVRLRTGIRLPASVLLCLSACLCVFVSVCVCLLLSHVYRVCLPVCVPLFACAQGWKVVWLPQDIWMDALQAKRQHNVRFSLLLDLVLPQAPFTTRE